MTSPERWEVTQLIKSGVLSVKDYPDFDDETGQVPCPPDMHQPAPKETISVTYLSKGIRSQVSQAPCCILSSL